MFAYLFGSNTRLAENPDDKLLPAPTPSSRHSAVTRSRKTGAAAKCCGGSTPARVSNALSLRWVSAQRRHRASVSPSAPCPSFAPCCPVRRRARDDSAACDPARFCSSCSAWRSREDRADRDRRRAGHRARCRAARRRAAQGATDQGTDAGRLQLAACHARDPAAVVAASDRRTAAHTRLRVVVPDRRRSHRLDRRSRLSHFPRAPLSRDGCDPALRRLDHAARVHHGLAAAQCARASFPGRRRR